MPARRFTSSFKRSPMELALSRFIPGALCCPCSEAIAPVEGERAGETSRERRDDPASPPLDARLFAHAACYHPPARGKPPAPSLDVVFHKDPGRLRPGHESRNTVAVRHVAMDLLHGAKVRHEASAWDTDHLEAILRQHA